VCESNKKFAFIFKISEARCPLSITKKGKKKKRKKCCFGFAAAREALS